MPKDNRRDTRLIFHLSYPRNKGLSLNENTQAHMCTVTYPDFNKVIELCRKARRACKTSKSDMKSAFRNLGILRSQWKYLIMKAQSPVDNKWYYFVDKCLPFGAAISCAIFQAFSNAVAHIVKIKSGEKINYLDDFLFIALLKAMCDARIELFLSICRRINFPVVLEKTVYATTQIVLLIDTVTQLVLLPTEKIDKVHDIISKALNKPKGKVTVKQLQQKKVVCS